jgi:hypothetical protein
MKGPEDEMPEVGEKPAESPATTAEPEAPASQEMAKEQGN